MYREFAPPAVPGLACLWVRTVEEDGSTRVLPDACVDLVWSAGLGLVLAGPDTAGYARKVSSGDVIVGARFAPGAGGPALGMPLSEIRDARLPFPIDDLDGSATPADALAKVARVAADMSRERPPDRAIRAAARRLTDPRQRVDTLADDLGLSERQLRRRCTAAVGYGPKVLQRVLRFQRFLALTDDDLAQRALAAGYADQAHLTRECTGLSGLSPAALLRSRAAAA